MFIPGGACCAPFANIRRYEPDGSGTIIAERANEFWRGNGGGFSGIRFGARAVGFCKTAAGYLWVMYHLPARDSGGQVIPIDFEQHSFDVTVLKRYSLDLSEEETYSYTLSGLTLQQGTTPQTLNPMQYLPNQALFPEFNSFDVMPDGSPFAVIAYKTGAEGLGQPFTYKLRAWNPDGSIKWTVNNPATTIGSGRICSTHMGSDGVWMVWTRGVPGPIEPGDPSPSMDTALEVYADLRSTSTGALITRLSIQALHNLLSASIWPDTAFGDINPFISTAVGGGRIAVVSRKFPHDPSTDSSAGPWHFRAAILKADATDYTWFRLRRPMTGGGTNGFAGWQALGNGYQQSPDPYAQVTFAIAPISTKQSGQALGLWVCCQRQQVGADWWMFTIDGNYLQEYETLAGTPTFAGPGTQSLILPGTAVTTQFSHNIQPATHADFDDNGALHYVRENIANIVGQPLIDRGTVLAVRNNLSQIWLTPEFNQLPQEGTEDVQGVQSRLMSIAYDSSDVETSYYLVGPSAF